MKRTLVKIVLVKENPDVPCWPCVNHDADKEASRILEPILNMNPDMDFRVVSYTDLSEAQADYESDREIYDGVLVLPMTCWKGIDIFYMRQCREGIPTIVADVPYCGSGTVLERAIPTAREENLPAPILSTLNYNEIAEAVRLFDVIAKLKQTTVLVISSKDTVRCEEGLAKEWGCKFIHKTGADIMRAIADISPDAAASLADRWIKDADEVREASREDIVGSATLHLALKALMAECGADAVTVDCLNLSYGGDYGKDIKMYPCLSHYEMLNNGTVAVCEADVSSTVTSLIFKYLTGRPGYVSDPVIDTSSNQIIYAHCVSCTKVFGENDPRRCRFSIRSHAEDQKGASVQTYFPLGEQLTTAMVYPSSALIHSARSVGNVGYNEGCRSKLAAETNAEAVLRNWSGWWHRVTVFGDCRRLLMLLFKMKDLAVTEEDK